MFVEWLKEWYNSNVVGEEIGEIKIVLFEDLDLLDIVWKYLFEEVVDEERGSICSKFMEVLEISLKDSMSKLFVKIVFDNKVGVGNKEEIYKENLENKKVCIRVDEKMYKEEMLGY